MSESVQHALAIAGSVILACLVIVLAFTFYRQGKSVGNSASGKINDLAIEVDNAEVKQYDGMSITGSEVNNLAYNSTAGSVDHSRVTTTFRWSCSTKAAKNQVYTCYVKDNGDGSFTLTAVNENASPDTVVIEVQPADMSIVT